MASTATTLSEEVIIRRSKTKYHWPAVQLNFWLLIMIVGSATVLGIFANFMAIQTQLQLGTPWFVYPLFFYSLHCALSLLDISCNTVCLVVGNLEWCANTFSFFEIGISPTGSQQRRSLSHSSSSCCGSSTNGNCSRASWSWAVLSASCSGWSGL